MKSRHTTNRTGGMTLIEVLVVIFVIGVVVAIILSKLARLKHGDPFVCVNNLKMMARAFRVWEGDNGNQYPMPYALTNSATMKLIGGGNAHVLWQAMSN